MPENKVAVMSRKKKKRRFRSPLRLSAILIFFIASIVISFFMYSKNFDISSVPYEQDSEPDIKTPDTYIAVTDSDGSLTLDSAASESEVTTQLAPAGGSVNPVKQSSAKDESYLNECAFIGDSISTGLFTYGFVDGNNVLASVGLRIDNITEEPVKTLKYSSILVLDALKEMNPKHTYILLGSNGVSWLDWNIMYDKYSAFIDSIKESVPDTEIYIISVTPVGTMKENIDTVEHGRVYNSDIDSFNEGLLNLADSKNVYYIDVNSELKGANGKLPDDVTSDGMHFNKDTYQKFIDYILSHTVQ